METIITTDIQKAVFYLKQSQPVAFPTETVYGLGAGAFDPVGIQNIFSVKGRPSDNPLIVHISDFSQLEDLVENIPPDFYILAASFMPGPLTILLPKKKELPSCVTAGLEMVGIRMPSHPVARALIAAYGGPIAAPSANLSGRPSGTTALHVLSDFKGKIPLILDGESPEGGIESTVIKLEGERVILLRPGMITKEEIARVLGKPVFQKGEAGSIPEAPGMKYRHYAPQAEMKLFEDLRELRECVEKNRNKKLLILSHEALGFAELEPLNEESFYRRLRDADQRGVELILIYVDPWLKSKEGLINRVLKASS